MQLAKVADSLADFDVVVAYRPKRGGDTWNVLPHFSDDHDVFKNRAENLKYDTISKTNLGVFKQLVITAETMKALAETVSDSKCDNHGPQTKDTTTNANVI